MSLLAVPAIIEIVSDIIDRVVPDKNAREKAKEEAALKIADLAAEQGRQQSEVNKQEAGHASVFVAGWRPFIGWVCGVALSYHFVVQPLLAFLMALTGNSFLLPVFDMDALMTILLGMLGLGFQRSWEKVSGVAQGLPPKVRK